MKNCFVYFALQWWLTNFGVLKKNDVFNTFLAITETFYLGS